MEWVTDFANLGVGCVLAAMIFWMYRIDRKQSEALLARLLEADQKTREKNTDALSELTTTLRDLRNGNGR